MTPYWPIDKFAISVAERFRATGHPSAVGVADLLATTTGNVPLVTDTCMPVLVHLEMAIAAVHGDQMLQFLGSAPRQLGWTDMGGLAEMPPAMRARHANIELVGPDGAPITETRFRLGLYLQAPHTQYPRHWHTAEEFFVVLSGTANWAVGAAPATVRRPGDFIRHGPDEPHAMRTFYAPLLTVWVWVGNLDTGTYRIDANVRT